jgi:hypothetical protein
MKRKMVPSFICNSLSSAIQSKVPPIVPPIVQTEDFGKIMFSLDNFFRLYIM